MIHALNFYLASLLITPVFREFEYGIARMFSLLVLSSATFALSIFLPFKTAFYISFSAMLLISILRIKDFKIPKEEAVFAATYSFFTILRFVDPTILDAEKFMDMAFVNSILKATSMPPDDPFMAGMKLDCYYYFGHVIAATIVMMSFAPPEIGYNVAVAAIPAYSALLFYEFSRSLRWTILALFSGNLFAVVDLVDRIARARPIDGSYYWNATRVIEGTINEFPYFSFIHADLHAHVIAIPLVLLLFVSLQKRRYEVLPLTLFAIFASNTWYFPLSLLLVVGTFDRKVIAYSSLSFIPILAFYLSMNTPAAKVEFVGEKSDPLQFLLYAAFPLAVCYLSTDRRALYSLPIAIAASTASPILALLIPVLFTKRQSLPFAVAAFAAFTIPEFVAVESRMNTVFKFYLFGWLSAYAAASLSVERKKLLTVLLALSLVYPVVATPVRYHEFENTLDGMNFVRSYGEYEALKWLQERRGVVIEEGCSKILCAYHYGGRVAAFTGNPAVIAWTNHEYVWRRDMKEIVERSRDVESFYRAESCDEMWRIVEKYNVSYIFVGVEEERVFGVKAEKFERCFEKVFEDVNAVVFSAKDKKSSEVFEHG
ncbi:MAG: DUF2298 domain-containing protein [Archaeoglobaceae archaeon]